MIVDAVVPAVLRSPILLVFQEATEFKVFKVSKSLRGAEEWNLQSVKINKGCYMFSNVVNQVLGA